MNSMLTPEVTISLLAARLDELDEHRQALHWKREKAETGYRTSIRELVDVEFQIESLDLAIGAITKRIIREGI